MPKTTIVGHLWTRVQNIKRRQHERSVCERNARRVYSASMFALQTDTVPKVGLAGTLPDVQ